MVVKQQPSKGVPVTGMDERSMDETGRGRVHQSECIQRAFGRHNFRSPCLLAPRPRARLRSAPLARPLVIALPLVAEVWTNIDLLAKLCGRVSHRWLSPRANRMKMVRLAMSPSRISWWDHIGTLSSFHQRSNNLDLYIIYEFRYARSLSFAQCLIFSSARPATCGWPRSTDTAAARWLCSIRAAAAARAAALMPRQHVHVRSTICANTRAQ
jgi:hypothetical protein